MHLLTTIVAAFRSTLISQVVWGRKVILLQQDVSFGEAFRFWVRLGFINFGGPAGQIAIVHRELVERKRPAILDRRNPGAAL